MACFYTLQICIYLIGNIDFSDFSHITLSTTKFHPLLKFFRKIVKSTGRNSQAFVCLINKVKIVFKIDTYMFPPFWFPKGNFKQLDEVFSTESEREQNNE